MNDLEKLETAKGDSPMSRILIKEAKVLYNPFSLENITKKKHLNEEINPKIKLKEDIGGWFSNPMKNNVPKQKFGEGIGKYINPKLFQQQQQKENANLKKRKENPSSSSSSDNNNNNKAEKSLEPEKKKQKKGGNQFDFNGW